MGRFIRDFGFLGFFLLVPVGVYCLWVGTENHSPDAPVYLIGGAALASGGLVGLFSSVREHFILREHVRYAQGKRGRGTSDPH